MRRALSDLREINRKHNCENTYIFDLQFVNAIDIDLKCNFYISYYVININIYKFTFVNQNFGVYISMRVTQALGFAHYKQASALDIQQSRLESA